MSLKDKVAIITGGVSGIGKACVYRFLKEGAKVLIADVDEEQAEKLLICLDGWRDSVLFRKTDVSNKLEVEGMIKDVVETFGRIDILINNAAVLRIEDFLELSEDDFDSTVKVNLKGYFLCGQAAARQMVKQGNGGAIINMSSVQAILTVPNILPYVVCKGGVNQMTKAMAISLATENIRVNAIGPGTIMTDMARSLLEDEQSMTKVLSRTPMGRCGEPEEIANIAVFLSDSESSYITGECIYADGGRLGLNYTV